MVNNYWQFSNNAIFIIQNNVYMKLNNTFKLCGTFLDKNNFCKLKRKIIVLFVYRIMHNNNLRINNKNLIFINQWIKVNIINKLTINYIYKKINCKNCF